MSLSADQRDVGKQPWLENSPPGFSDLSDLSKEESGDFQSVR